MGTMKRGVDLRSREQGRVPQKMRALGIELMRGRARNAPSCNANKNLTWSPSWHDAKGAGARTLENFYLHFPDYER